LLDVIAVDAGEAIAIAPECFAEWRQLGKDDVTRLTARPVLAGERRNRECRPRCKEEDCRRRRPQRQTAAAIAVRPRDMHVRALNAKIVPAQVRIIPYAALDFAHRLRLPLWIVHDLRGTIVPGSECKLFAIIGPIVIGAAVIASIEPGYGRDLS